MGVDGSLEDDRYVDVIEEGKRRDEEAHRKEGTNNGVR